MIVRCAVIMAGVPKMPDMGAPAKTRVLKVWRISVKINDMN